MDKILPYDFENPLVTISTGHREAFREAFLEAWQALSVDQLWAWLARDVYASWFLQWVDPVLSRRVCSLAFSSVSIRTSHRTSLLHTLRSRWTRERILEVFRGELWPLFRVQIDTLYDLYRKRYDKVVFLAEYLELSLPFYWQDRLVYHYVVDEGSRPVSCPRIVVAARGPKEPSVIFYRAALPTLSEVVVPYGLMYVIKALQTVPDLSWEIIQKCLYYFLRPAPGNLDLWTFRSNQERRTLGWGYGE